VTAAESASNSLMRLTSDRCHVCHLVMPVIGRLRSKENTRPLDHLLGLSDRLLRPDISGTDVARYQFLYELKAGPAGGRLRRPSSAGNDTTVTAEPASPFTPGDAATAASCHRSRSGRRKDQELNQAPLASSCFEGRSIRPPLSIEGAGPGNAALRHEAWCRVLLTLA
jgi:hypothetical protein